MKITIYKLLTVILSLSIYSCSSTAGTDSVDVYKMYLGKSKIFTQFSDFVLEHGLPKKVQIYNDTIPILSENQFDSIVNPSQSQLSLLYDGYTMDYFDDGEVIMSSIDLRKSKEGLKYDDVIFDNQFTFDDFKKMFPQSANQNMDFLEQSLFEMTTKESLPASKSYMVSRKSKDDPFAEPILEFTFLDGKLIYIFFANF